MKYEEVRTDDRTIHRFTLGYGTVELSEPSQQAKLEGFSAHYCNGEIISVRDFNQIINKFFTLITDLEHLYNKALRVKALRGEQVEA